MYHRKNPILVSLLPEDGFVEEAETCSIKYCEINSITQL